MEALRSYEQARLEKTANSVLSNRRHGPEVVMQMVEERAPEGFTNLGDVITQEFAGNEPLAARSAM